MIWVRIARSSSTFRWVQSPLSPWLSPGSKLLAGHRQRTFELRNLINLRLSFLDIGEAKAVNL